MKRLLSLTTVTLFSLMMVNPVFAEGSKGGFFSGLNSLLDDVNEATSEIEKTSKKINDTTSNIKAASQRVEGTAKNVKAVAKGEELLAIEETQTEASQ
ncbi:hypothetical protein [Oceanicoccus sagamiensis]|uniref:Uncharacterized protein n=1 Tax=Oceanicoccus sagamiensis TaxID=716816 RepID=A0A1X9N8F9_9GAMM|nr:hypothetical protein [Oceanicoccus sagamiensis]ARN73966.1 hypothetical protein BST96_07450 [Oceanicoccus sagamiensis]